MGCLTVQVINQTVSSATVNVVQENTVPLVATQCCGTPITINADYDEIVLHTDTENKNVPVEVENHNYNIKVSIRAGLVCGVGLDKYEIVFVDEGPLCVEEGYLRVRKTRI